ncbi:MAG TPA: serine/threonine protein kinase [Elainellaceae cyanobacterium]
MSVRNFHQFGEMSVETAHQTNDTIANRYQIIAPLGVGGMGTTYDATDLRTQQRVAIKTVSLRQMGDWKVLELLEREANVLSALDHPAIPRYVDYFHIDTEGDRQFYLVRDLIPGDSLANLIKQGWHVDEASLIEIVVQILDILNYIHRLSPPVIHRDIKPENIICQPDGTIFLVDFGAVQDIYRYTISKSGTFVGTIGYMPPEQFRGQVTPASDLYALGATIVFLLTGRSPDELPQRRMKIDFRPHVRVSSRFANWLDRLLEPAVEDRIQSAQDALDALRQEPVDLQVEGRSLPVRLQKPAGTRVTLQRTPSELRVQIPPIGINGQTLSLGVFALFWNTFLVVWTVGAASASIFFALFSIPFWLVGLGLMGRAIGGAANRVQFELDSDRFCLVRQILLWNHTITGNTRDLSSITANDNTGFSINNMPVRSCALQEGVRTHRFGSTLTSIEQEWLAAEISAFLDELHRDDWE